MKFYPWTTPGNPSTGGKLKHSGVIHNNVKLVSGAINVLNAFSIYTEWKSNSISDFQARGQVGILVYSIWGPHGWAMGVGATIAEIKNYLMTPMFTEQELRTIIMTQSILDAEVPKTKQ
jgi:hypothetical protein